VSRPVRVVIAATTAPWSAALRSYVRDHAQGVRVEVVMDRAALARTLGAVDVLFVDDVMRTFSASDIFRAQQAGAFVIGVSDQAGAGEKYLAELGVDKVVTAVSPTAELVALAWEASKASGTVVGREAVAEDFARARAAGTANERGTRLPVLSVWTKVSGGVGLSEAVVAAAEHLSQCHRVLLVEAEELSPVMLSRLSRSPEGGLPWAVSRKAQGLPALPDALSAPRQASPVIGHFDVVCAAANPAQALNASHLESFILEAVSSYDCVLVEASWLVGSPTARERFSATRALLQRAASVVVLAAPDPEGAARLVQWKSVALAHGIEAPTWAAFGRARPSRYERSHLGSIVESNTGRYPFARIVFLPEDPLVARARWNGELVWKGPFQRAVGALATEAVGSLLPSRRRGWGALATAARVKVEPTAVLVPAGTGGGAAAHSGNGART
jgi:hypothetical protein